MKRYNFGGEIIASVGYNAQYAVLEVEFVKEGTIWQYLNVPEEIWYRFKSESYPDLFFHQNIKGRFDEKQIGRIRVEG